METPVAGQGENKELARRWKHSADQWGFQLKLEPMVCFLISRHCAVGLIIQWMENCVNRCPEENMTDALEKNKKNKKNE